MSSPLHLGHDDLTSFCPSSKLFAYERLDAVPIDVWIHRILMVMRKGRKGTPDQLARYAQKRLGTYAGYVQQYLFHIARTKEKPASKLGAFPKINGENLI